MRSSPLKNFLSLVEYIEHLPAWKSLGVGWSASFIPAGFATAIQQQTPTEMLVTISVASGILLTWLIIGVKIYGLIISIVDRKALQKKADKEIIDKAKEILDTTKN